MLLADKVALITGASRGIGKATAQLFAKEGAKVILHGRDELALQQLAEELTAQGSTVPTIVSYDVDDLSAMKQAFQTIHGKYAQLDILVNNAGTLANGLLGMLQAKQVETAMSVNVHAVLYHMQYASRLMMKKRNGSIINISSIMGVEGEVGQTVYAASKAAIIGATKSAAKELASANIRVNAVAPGVIDTDMVRTMSEEKYAERVASVSLKRIGQPEEVANGILFLASEMASYITGQVLGIDGGMII